MAAKAAPEQAYLCGLRAWPAWLADVRFCMSGRGLAVVSEAEGVTGWVEEHSDVLLRLMRSHRWPEGNGLGDRGVEVADLEVEVHHRTLLPVDWRPYGAW